MRGPLNRGALKIPTGNVPMKLAGLDHDLLVARGHLEGLLDEDAQDHLEFVFILHIYVYVYIHLSHISIYIYIYIYMCMCMNIYIYIYYILLLRSCWMKTLRIIFVAMTMYCYY